MSYRKEEESVRKDVMKQQDLVKYKGRIIPRTVAKEKMRAAGHKGAQYGHLGANKGALGAPFGYGQGHHGFLGKDDGHKGASFGHLGCREESYTQGHHGIKGADYGGKTTGLKGKGFGHLGGPFGHLGASSGYKGREFGCFAPADKAEEGRAIASENRIEAAEVRRSTPGEAIWVPDTDRWRCQGDCETEFQEWKL